MENLHGHMKTAFKFVMSVYKEFEEILKSQGRSFALEKMIEEVITTYNTFVNLKCPNLHLFSGNEVVYDV